MLAIRMKRTGRSGHAHFRVIVQDSHFHPTRGKVVAYLGSYDPHQKTIAIDKELAAKYLASGAQPSDSAARLLKKEGVKLPDWFSFAPNKTSKIKHPEKLRRNRPAEAAPAKPAAEPTETPAEVLSESTTEAEEPAKETAPEAETATEEPAEALAEPETPAADQPSPKPAAQAETPVEETPSEPTDGEQPA